MCVNVAWESPHLLWTAGFNKRICHTTVSVLVLRNESSTVSSIYSGTRQCNGLVTMTLQRRSCYLLSFLSPSLPPSLSPPPPSLQLSALMQSLETPNTSCQSLLAAVHYIKGLHSFCQLKLHEAK